MLQNIRLARTGQHLRPGPFLHGFEHPFVGGQQIERTRLHVVHLDIFQIHAEDFHRRQAENDFAVDNIHILRRQLVQIQTGQHLAAHDKDAALRVLPQHAPVAFFLGADNRVDIERRAFQPVYLLNLHQHTLARQHLMRIVCPSIVVIPAAETGSGTQQQHRQPTEKTFHLEPHRLHQPAYRAERINFNHKGRLKTDFYLSDGLCIHGVCLTLI